MWLGSNFGAPRVVYSSYCYDVTFPSPKATAVSGEISNSTVAPGRNRLCDYVIIKKYNNIQRGWDRISALQLLCDTIIRCDKNDTYYYSIHSYRPSTPLTHSGDNDDDNWYINNHSRLLVVLRLMYLYKSQLFGNRNVHIIQTMLMRTPFIISLYATTMTFRFYRECFCCRCCRRFDDVRRTSPFHRRNILLYPLLQYLWYIHIILWQLTTTTLTEFEYIYFRFEYYLGFRLFGTAVADYVYSWVLLLYYSCSVKSCSTCRFTAAAFNFL